MDQPTSRRQDHQLETERLFLRPWRVSEAEIQHKLWTERDPRVPPHRRTSPDGSPTVDDLAERIRTARPINALGLPAIEVKATGDVVGYCGLNDNAYGQPDEPELAFELLSRTWGQGYATEASWAVIIWAQVAGYQRLWATVRDWNDASRRVLAKLGFTETDRVEPDEVHGDSLFTTKQL